MVEQNAGNLCAPWLDGKARPTSEQGNMYLQLRMSANPFMMAFLQQYWLVMAVVSVLGFALFFLLFRLNNKHRKRLQQQLDHDSYPSRHQSGRDAEVPEVDNE